MTTRVNRLHFVQCEFEAELPDNLYGKLFFRFYDSLFADPTGLWMLEFQLTEDVP
ncbi:hypothetical protein [Nocardia nova]|uniref:hypothetical protein n=1 Tax=Nocardia nova TaxID=37330 RepID=UPI00273A2F99|nr:hypothetical protein [Nocardia nova]